MAATAVGLAVWLVIVAAVVAILRLLIPWVLGLLGGQLTIIGQVINIVLWAIIAIFVIYICFALISCLVGGGFPLLPPMPHR